MNKVVPLRGFGGGVAMNFKVTGNSKPSNPDENTVWIDTDVPISGWVFSSKNPFIDYHDVDLIKNAKTADGYISSAGAIAAKNDENPEQYTKDYIPVEFEKKYDFIYTVSTVNSMYLTVAEYTSDKDGYSFIKRTNLVSNVSGTEQVGSYTPSSDSVKAVRLSWRTFPETEYSMRFIEKSVPYTIDGTENGTVFILTGFTSSVEFNALKKNGITIYPVAASQYIDGNWLDRPAEIFQNGSWTEWTFYLFKESAGFAAGYTGFSNAEFTDDLITVTIKTSGGSRFSILNEKVDVSNYKTAFFEIQKASFFGASGYSQEIYLHVGDVRVRVGDAISGSSGTFVTDGIVELDISELSGKVDVQVSAYSSDSDTVTFKMAIKNIYFRRGGKKI